MSGLPSACLQRMDEAGNLVPCSSHLKVVSVNAIISPMFSLSYYVYIYIYLVSLLSTGCPTQLVEANANNSSCPKVELLTFGSHNNSTIMRLEAHVGPCKANRHALYFYESMLSYHNLAPHKMPATYKGVLVLLPHAETTPTFFQCMLSFASFVITYFLYPCL